MQGTGPALGGSEPHAVLCETCSVLLCVHEHLEVDMCDVSHSTAIS